MEDSRAHWQRVYVERGPEEVSWYEKVPETSLELIQEAALPLDAAILDVGGGASSLAGHLVAAGYTDVTVADVARAALEQARFELGAAAKQATWIEADVRFHHFARLVDLWHDRAVFHFMVDPADRERYLTALARTLRPGGHLILATFGPSGPTRCSGLPVTRYGSDELSSVLGEEFELISSRLEEHHTPGGQIQEFLYAHLRRKASTGR
jgi:SAM-dependent methyltransferase